MKGIIAFLAITLGAGATLAADEARERPGASLEGLGTAGADQLSPGDGRTDAGQEHGGVLTNVLEKLGVDPDDLAETLAEVELVGDNWRDESSGEVGFSFGLGRGLEVGPSFGLRYEQENFGGPHEAWSHQLKLGARYSF